MTKTDTQHAQTNATPKPSICVNKIIRQAKEDYLEHWRSQTTSQSRINLKSDPKKRVYMDRDLLCQRYETGASPDQVQAQ